CRSPPFARARPAAWARSGAPSYRRRPPAYRARPCGPASRGTAAPGPARRGSRPLRQAEHYPDASTSPSDPFAHAAAHDPFEVIALQPRHLFGEHGDALAVAAGQAGPVGSPERAPWAIGVEDSADVGMHRTEGIGLFGGVARHGRDLGRHVGPLGERQHLIEGGEVGGFADVLRTLQAEMVEHQAQPRVAFGNLVGEMHVFVVEQDHGGNARLLPLAPYPGGT